MQASIISCKNCGHQFDGKYCNKCGEQVLTEHDKSIKHFFEEGFHFLTHFEGKFFTTLKTLSTRPGKLSEDFALGKRKIYFKPLSFFLMLVIIYLVFPVFEGLNMKLFYHMEHKNYGGMATGMVNEIMQSRRLSFEEVSLLFTQKSEKVSKFLLLILIPLTALFFWAVSFRRRKYYYDQLLLATEINSVYLFFGFMILPLLLTAFLWLCRLTGLPIEGVSDDVIGLLLYIPLCIYTARAAMRFYGFGKGKAVVFGIYFYFVHHIVVQIIYKFILFLLVINQIH